jgi:protoporphyrinogen oxidase
MRVGIVGGGITGLTTAYYSLKAGHQATIFEAAPEVGGLAASVQVQGVWVDKFYHCILPSDVALLSLVEELGLGADIYWRETEMGFLYRDRLYPLTTPWDLLRFSALSPIDRLRLGVTGLYARRLKDWRALERVTAREWLTRWCGERAFNTIWKPLLVFKFGEHWREAPATYLWARVKRQGTTRQKRSSKETLAYVRGGFKAIIEALAATVRRMGGVIHTGTRVDSIATAVGRVAGLVVGGELRGFDKVVSTLPGGQFLRLIDPDVLGDEFRHDGIAYQGAVNVLLVMKEPLSRYYWLPAVESGVPFAGVVETTNLIRSEDLGGISLVYLVNYVSREDPLFRAEPDALIEQSVRELARVFPGFRATQVLESHVHRAGFVEPVWTVNYSDRVPRRVLLNDTLFVLTTAQLYPEINSTSNCVGQVRATLDRLLADPLDGSPVEPGRRYTVGH